MAYEDFRHRHALRVRWAEVDMQGVVFNGHYLTYCDVCITEYWRAIGVPYPQDFHERGHDTFVRKASVEYLAAARYDPGSLTSLIRTMVVHVYARLGLTAGFAPNRELALCAVRRAIDRSLLPSGTAPRA